MKRIYIAVKIEFPVEDTYITCSLILLLISIFVKTGNNDSETGVPHVSLSKALPTTTSTKARRKKVTRPGPVSAGTTVKNERCSPDPIGMGTESSRSDSPNSPSGGSFRTQSFANSTTPPINSSFTPPDRFNSPGNYSNGSNNKIVMEGLHMSRNYSDFMRSLAAKYNNNNNNQDQPVRPATNSFNIPLLDPRFSSSFKGNSFPHLLGNLPLNNKKDLENLAAAAAGTKKDLLMPSPLSMMAGGPQHHIPGFPMMMDMSSTQALLNIVRSASAQNAQQLESYLRGAAAGTVPTSPIVNNNVSATKRSAETAGLMSSPLDLSASMVHKRPYMEPRGALKSPLVAGDYPAGKVSPPSSRSTPTNRGELNARRVTTPKTVQPSPQSAVAALPMSCRLSCAADACTPGAVQVRGWAVAEVVDFVKSIDLCAEYAQVRH